MRKLFLSLLFLALALPALAGDLPDHALTPGGIAYTDTAVVCQRDFLTVVNPRPRIPLEMQHAIFAAYGIPWSDRKLYELDHLVMRGLGGADVQENLWPELWAGQWGAHTKDRLEVELRKRVCRGEMTLEDAQKALAGDWISEYKRVFGDPTQ